MKNFRDIKTFADACKSLSIKTFGDAYKVLQLKRTLLSDTSIEECDDSVLKLIIICRALNGRWFSNWRNSNEKKWFPYFYYNNESGFGFSNTHYDWTVTRTGVGSRLCFLSSEIAEYAGITFIELYKEMMCFDGEGDGEDEQKKEEEEKAKRRELVLSKLSHEDREALELQ